MCLCMNGFLFYAVSQPTKKQRCKIFKPKSKKISQREDKVKHTQTHKLKWKKGREKLRSVKNNMEKH